MKRFGLAVVWATDARTTVDCSDDEVLDELVAELTKDGIPVTEKETNTFSCPGKALGFLPAAWRLAARGWEPYSTVRLRDGDSIELYFRREYDGETRSCPIQ